MLSQKLLMDYPCPDCGKTKEEIKKTDRKKTYGQGSCSEKNARDGIEPSESKIISILILKRLLCLNSQELRVLQKD